MRHDDVSPLAQVVDRALARDAEHPGAQRQTRVVTIVDPPHLVEHPLQNVFDVRLGDEAPEIGDHERPEGAIAVLERLRPPLIEALAYLGESSVHVTYSLWVGHPVPSAPSNSGASTFPRTSPSAILPMRPGALAEMSTSSPSRR